MREKRISKKQAQLEQLINKIIKEIFEMETKIYTIKDNVTQVFGGIMTAPFDGVIIRDLTNVLAKKDTNNELFVNADDKDLYCLGTYDVDTGEVKSDLKFVIHLAELKGV